LRPALKILRPRPFLAIPYAPLPFLPFPCAPMPYMNPKRVRLCCPLVTLSQTCPLNF
jgi:hypothetical protein